MAEGKSIETEILKVEKTALVVIDLQNGIANRERKLSPYPADQVIENASRLVLAFTAKGAFAVLVRVSSIDGKDMPRPDTDWNMPSPGFQEGWDDFVPQLASFQNVHRVIKRQWGAFYGTDLDLQLRRRGIDTVVLCGISTGIGVDTTAREAYQHGYHQIFVEDAMAAQTREEHDYVCQHIFPRIGRIRTTSQVVELLSRP